MLRVLSTDRDRCFHSYPFLLYTNFLFFAIGNADFLIFFEFYAFFRSAHALKEE